MIKAACLKTEYRNNPVGIDEKTPRFSWKLISDKKDVIQQSYRIVVTDESGNVSWDSGIVNTDESIGVCYQGNPLKPKTRYFWTVTVTDSTKDTSVSEPAYFETGFLKEVSWMAKWIESDMEIRLKDLEAANGFEMHGPTYGTDREGYFAPPVLFHKTFSCPDLLKKARLYITAHGVYSVSVNGRKIEDCILAPEMTSYDSILQYQTYDVQDYLHPGENTLVVTVADGWHCGCIGMTGELHQFSEKPALLCQLEMTDTDGKTESIISDGTFTSNIGKYRYADLFVGAKYDNRLPDLFSDESYAVEKYGVSEKEYGYETLTGQMAEPIVKTREVKAKKAIITPQGDTVLDFGQNLVGVVRMKVQGKAGDTVTLIHTEELDKDGNFMMSITGNNKDQTDIYVLSGEGEEVFEPEFTYHGFRYVKVVGYPGKAKPDDFTAVVIGNQLEETSEFTCSDDRLTRLYQNVLWSQRGNMIAIPTDCPQREKAGWTGDIEVFSSAACLNMNMDSFLARWLKSVAAEQREDGQIPYLVPFFQGYDFLSKMVFGGVDKVASCGWGDASVIVPWNLYLYYRDRENLRQCYPMMKKWMDYVEREARENVVEPEGVILTAEQRERQKYLWNTGFHFGDWLLPSVTDLTGGNVEAMFTSAFLTKEVVATCYFAYSSGIMAEVCKVLEMEDQAVYYQKLNEKIRKAFSEEYLHEDGTFTADLQGVYVLALYMKMIPENMVEKVSAHLVSLIEKNGNCLDTGFLSVAFLMDALIQSGHKDTAYKVLFNNRMPSWLYEVEQGATTIWESWSNILPDGTRLPMSYNHYAYGCIQEFIFRHMAGIKMGAPGYKKIIIDPDYSCGLQNIKASYDSIYGKISVEWMKEEEGIHLKVEIPANTSARICLGDEVKETGSGKYEFEV